MTAAADKLGWEVLTAMPWDALVATVGWSRARMLTRQRLLDGVSVGAHPVAAWHSLSCACGYCLAEDEIACSRYERQLVVIAPKGEACQS